MDAYRNRTNNTFARLQSGQLKISQMSTSQLKSYMTGIAMFKQEQLDHYQAVQYEFRLRTMPDTLKNRTKGGRLAAKNSKAVPVPTHSPPISSKKQPHLGSKIKEWILKKFPCLHSPNNDIEMKLITQRQQL